MSIRRCSQLLTAHRSACSSPLRIQRLFVRWSFGGNCSVHVSARLPGGISAGAVLRHGGRVDERWGDDRHPLAAPWKRAQFVRRRPLASVLGEDAAAYGNTNGCGPRCGPSMSVAMSVTCCRPFKRRPLCSTRGAIRFFRWTKGGTSPTTSRRHALSSSMEVITCTGHNWATKSQRRSKSS